MNCKLCTKGYNFSNNKPLIILYCGHTFCLSCIKASNDCPECRQEITAFKPNFTLLDILENLNVNLNESTTIATEDKSNEINKIEKKIYSANHKHLFKLETNYNDTWKCSGFRILGNCRSNLDEKYISFIKRYSCNKCSVKLCEPCFKSPKIINHYYSKNHLHPFNKSKKDDGNKFKIIILKDVLILKIILNRMVM